MIGWNHLHAVFALPWAGKPSIARMSAFKYSSVDELLAYLNVAHFLKIFFRFLG